MCCYRSYNLLRAKSHIVCVRESARGQVCEFVFVWARETDRQTLRHRDIETLTLRVCERVEVSIQIFFFLLFKDFTPVPLNLALVHPTINTTWVKVNQED